MDPNQPQPAQTPETNPAPTVAPSPPETPAVQPAVTSSPTSPAAGSGQNEVADLPGTPESWPGAFGVYKFSKAAVQHNLTVIVLIWLVGVLGNVLIDAVLGKQNSTLSAIAQVLSYVLSSFVSVAATLVYLAGVKREKRQLGPTLQASLPLTLKMVGLTLLVTVTAVVSLLLLIIPFFFVFPRFSLVNYFLVDKNMGVMEAYKASWAATKGNVGKVYGIAGANLAMALLALTIIGIPFSIYFLIMYSAATAVLYSYLQKISPATAPVAPTPVAPPTV